jgi:hypothetical protein
MWINLSDDEIASIEAAQSGRHKWGPSPLEALVERIATQKTEQADYQSYRDAISTHDELEVDDDAMVSVGDDPGAWVHAWIWVSNEEAGIPDEEDES